MFARTVLRMRSPPNADTVAAHLTALGSNASEVWDKLPGGNNDLCTTLRQSLTPNDVLINAVIPM